MGSKMVEKPEEGVLTLDEVAARLRTSVTTVRRLCDLGKLRAMNIGTGTHKIWRVRQVDLNSYMTTPQVAAQPEQPFIELA